MKKEKKKGTVRAVKILVAVMAVLVIAVGAYIFLQVTSPYAITAGGHEIVRVDSQAAAEKVIEEVITDYCPEGTQIDSYSIDKKLSVRKIDVSELRDSDTMTKKAAVDYILEKNSSDDPLFSVTVTGTTSKLEEYTPPVDYVKNENMFAGESSVQDEGEPGSQLVTSTSTMVNGEVTETEKSDVTIIDEGSPEVIAKGTLGLPKDADWVTYDGDPVFENGQEMVTYSKRYLGAPYKYGGYSFKTGIDCVQFVRAMYKKYGITLPNNHKGIQHSGVGVSLKNAKAGDIVCYKGHVALYMGNGKVINATRKHGIKISNVHMGKKLITIRRIVK